MLDLAARVSAEVRDPARARRRSARAAGLPLRPEATSLRRSIGPRTGRRTPWRPGRALLGAVAAPERPVVLALHPGTRAALDAGGVCPSRRVVVDRAAGLSIVAGAAAPRRRRADRFGRRSARVGLAGRSVPGSPNDDRMGRDRRRRRQLGRPRRASTARPPCASSPSAPPSDFGAPRRRPERAANLHLGGARARPNGSPTHCAARFLPGGDRRDQATPRRPICMIVHAYYEEDARVRREAETLVAAGWEVDVFGLRRPGEERPRASWPA